MKRATHALICLVFMVPLVGFGRLPALPRATIAIPVATQRVVVRALPVALQTPAAPPRAPVTMPHVQDECTTDTALFSLASKVVIDGREMGRAAAWSCTSLAEAVANLNAQIAQVELTSWCWYDVGAPKTEACPLPPTESGIIPKH